MYKLLASSLFAALLAGCGNGGSDAETGNTSSLPASFEKGFKTSFRAKFVENCVAGAKKSSGLNADFTEICGCSADKLLATKSVPQLMTGPSDEDMRQAATACTREHPLKGV
jgi:hypothetical protein